MRKIYIPARSAEDWKQFLAKPEKQWKRGYSARTLAHAWQEADAMPTEIYTVLTQLPALQGLEVLLAIPEHQVSLPGGRTQSQNDVWVLAATDYGLVSIAVEGKVSEPFGPTVSEWFAQPSKGKKTRLRFLCDKLGISYPPPGNIRYQLLHRTASALIEAERFRCHDAVMAVHTFSSSDEWLADFQAFVALFGAHCDINEAFTIERDTDLGLHLAWIHGNEKYLGA